MDLGKPSFQILSERHLVFVKMRADDDLCSNLRLNDEFMT
jgi:hypothetical protein